LHQKSGSPALPRLRLWVTILLSLLVALLGTAFVVGVASSSRVSFLHEPGRTLDRVTGRDLDLLEALPTMPWWSVPVSRASALSREALLEQAIAAFRELLEEKDATSETRAMLGLLLLEAGQPDEGRRQLAAVDPDALTMTSEWARDRLHVPAAKEPGVVMSGDEARQRSAERGRRLLWRWAFFEWGQLLVFASGIVSLLAWVRRRCPALVLADGVTTAPWTIGRGYAVMVRSLWLGLVTLMLVVLSIPEGFRDVLLYLLVGAYLLWLARKHLFRPWGRTLSDGLGLRPSGRGTLLVLTTLSLVAVNQVAHSVMIFLAMRLGHTFHWTDMAIESVILGSWGTTLLVSLTAVVGAPLFEEIGFRGILFPTLNRKLGTISAALLSSAIFGAIHLYSILGLLSVTISGFFYALAYARTKSLLPAMAAHAIGNLFVFCWLMVVYR
jgi:membrane protease YdiL (CAAX protease family)